MIGWAAAPARSINVKGRHIDDPSAQAAEHVKEGFRATPYQSRLDPAMVAREEEQRRFTILQHARNARFNGTGQGRQVHQIYPHQEKREAYCSWFGETRNADCTVFGSLCGGRYSGDGNRACMSSERFDRPVIGSWAARNDIAYTPAERSNMSQSDQRAQLAHAPYITAAAQRVSIFTNIAVQKWLHELHEAGVLEGRRGMNYILVINLHDPNIDIALKRGTLLQDLMGYAKEGDLVGLRTVDHPEPGTCIGDIEQGKVYQMSNFTKTMRHMLIHTLHCERRNGRVMPPTEGPQLKVEDISSNFDMMFLLDFDKESSMTLQLGKSEGYIWSWWVPADGELRSSYQDAELEEAESMASLTQSITFNKVHAHSYTKGTKLVYEMAYGSCIRLYTGLGNAATLLPKCTVQSQAYVGTTRGTSIITFTALMPTGLTDRAHEAALVLDENALSTALYAAAKLLGLRGHIAKATHIMAIDKPTVTRVTPDCEGLRREGGPAGVAHITSSVPVRTKAIEEGRLGYNGGGSAWFTNPSTEWWNAANMRSNGRGEAKDWHHT